ncbi:hypothetical protein OS493_009010 [Desmophyllum pertusum]|uniref:HTH CENPB-type domain-containing protein n=1 Tax=Desmophyllum pertusum TaxID=174260 RepID=A0A9W9ZID7_9CNID|nr:hypothetical protein OS493_009010 [Desmophyllum pertusum]
MNRTLFSCGVKRKVATRSGEVFDVSATYPRSVKLSCKPVKCDICNECFTAKKYLETYIRFKHSENLHLEDLSKDKELTESTKPYKSEGTDLTDLKIKNKWEKVAKERGVSKSLVVKWNKNREKLKTEVELNKHKRNTGNLRAARQRRKLVDDKLNKKREKYPLAAVRVIVEFKLRRAKGCKISKLWLKKKMKATIETCYGKDEADKFKASNNWFDRFKRRHSISFRRRSKCTQQQLKMAVTDFGRRKNWKRIDGIVCGGRRGFQGFNVTRPRRGAPFELEGLRTATTIQNFMANPVTDPPIEFGSGKSLGAGVGTQPTYVYPESLKEVVRRIVAGDLVDKPDPTHQSVYHVNIGDLAAAKWPAYKKK